VEDEAGIFVAFEESAERITPNAAESGWDLAALQKKKLSILPSRLMCARFLPVWMQPSLAVRPAACDTRPRRMLAMHFQNAPFWSGRACRPFKPFAGPSPNSP
jgi:hypothetical protein